MIKAIAVGAVALAVLGTALWWQRPEEQQTLQLVGQIDMGSTRSPAKVMQEGFAPQIASASEKARENAAEETAKEAAANGVGKKLIPHYEPVSKLKDLLEKSRKADNSAGQLLTAMSDDDLTKASLCMAAEFGYSNSVTAKSLMIDAMGSITNRNQASIVQKQVDEIFRVAGQGKAHVDRLCR